VDLFSPRHLLIILLIVLLVFGTKKLKTIGADLGSAVRGFKESMKDAEQGTSTDETSAPAKQLSADDKPADKPPGTDKPASPEKAADKTTAA